MLYVDGWDCKAIQQAEGLVLKFEMNDKSDASIVFEGPFVSVNASCIMML